MVVMPDFFLDRLISLGKYDVPSFTKALAEVAERKGGSIDGIAQMDLRGGNAVNTASALAAMGAGVTPILCTNSFGLQQLRFRLKSSRIDLSHVKTEKSASLTTALEVRGENGKANVMLRDLGSLADFSPTSLTEKDFELIGKSDYVCLFNWAGTKKHGTELAKEVFRKVKSVGKGKTYFDSADPTPNRVRIPNLVNDVLKAGLVDILSLNENEAVIYASYFGRFQTNLRSNDFAKLALESARFLARQMDARIDLHATTFSGSFAKENEKIVPAFKVGALRATGAGDAWNAGNILADGNALSDECRLTLANAVSACYLSDPKGEHPTRERLINFLRHHQAT